MGFFANILQSAKNSGATSGVIGIDVGSSSIKLVELEERDEVLTLVTYGEVQLGPYADGPLGSVVPLNQKQQQAALVDVIRESAAKSRNAVFAMPLSASFISSTVIATGPDTDLAPLVRAEARKLIPASLSEVTLDWVELESGKNAEGRPVLVAAIQNNALDTFKVLLQFAGFTDAPTEIECFSMNRLLTGHKHAVVMDFGASTTKMYISHNGVLSNMHRINSGGAEITEAIMKQYDLEFEAAENLKLHCTPDSKEYEFVKSVYRDKYHRPLREFKQVLRQSQQTTGASFEQIHITGGATTFAGLSPLVADACDVAVVHVKPFDQVAYPAFMEDTMDYIGPTFAPALGAALRMFY